MKMPMDMKKKRSMSDLKMPAKRSSDMSDYSDMGPEEGSPEEEAGESPDEESAEDDQGHGDSSDALMKISDDDLMAEVKKRGLMAKLDEHDQHGSPDDSGHDIGM